MKVIHPTLLLCSLLALAGCKNDDSDFQDLLAQAKEQPIEIAFPTTPISEVIDTPPASSDDAYNDYLESYKPRYEIGITYDGENTTIVNPTRSVTISANKGNVTANIGTTAVNFVISGQSSNASLRINGDNRFQISLNGVHLTNPQGPVINNQCSKTLYILSADGTENYLESLAAPTEETDAKGCLFSEGQISFSGSGKLTVNSNFRNAIASDDYIVVRPTCNIEVSALSGNGIKANDGVRINGGTVSISSLYDGGKGINCEDYIDINGGLVTIINKGTTRLDQVPVSPEFKEGIDTVSCAGLKCDGNLSITGGTLRVLCEGNDSKGIKVNGAYSQTGGDVAIVTLGQKVLDSPKGLKTNGNLTISAGSFYAYSKHSQAIDSDAQISVYAYRKQKSYLVQTE